MSWLSQGELLVVETEDDWFLGTVEMSEGVLIVRSGFVGRPVLVEPESVVRISPFEDLDDDSMDSDA